MESNQNILENNQRIDGRSLDQVRPIEIETSVLSRTHGSALFTRGETQSIVVATLGSTKDAQRIENLNELIKQQTDRRNN